MLPSAYQVEPVILQLLDTSGVHVIAQDRTQHPSDPAFPFAAFSDDQEHLLGPIAGDHRITHEFLQNRNILFLQQIIQKCQPLLRFWRIRIISYRKAVHRPFFFFCKSSVQIIRSIGKMNPVFF